MYGRLGVVVVFAVLLLTSIADGRASRGLATPEAVIETLAHLPLGERRALHKGLTPQMKAEVWKAHVQRFRSDSSSLDQVQFDLLNRIEAAVTADVFTASVPTATRAFSLCKELSRSLSRAEAYRLHLLGGPLPDPKPRPSLKFSWSVPLVATLVAKSADECDCNGSTSCTLCQAPIAICLPSDGGQICSETSSGCGCLWLERCDGRCWTPPSAR